MIAITSELNRRRLLIRGKPFRTGIVHAILHRSTYNGTHHYNQTDSRTDRHRRPEEWVPCEVPAIISREEF